MTKVENSKHYDAFLNRERRQMLRWSASAMGALFITSALPACGNPAVRGRIGGPVIVDPDVLDLNQLGDADENGVRLHSGFSSRVVARSSEAPLAGTDYRWHAAPDGGATFSTGDGGWIYVSNSEISKGGGGVGALRFDAKGQLTDAYPILEGSHRNCAGGPTPWGTWLSCEEVDAGRVWECDPFGEKAAVLRPALGIFNHEAVTVDSKQNQLYLTEDEPDGRLYRFTPDRLNAAGYPDLESGRMAVAHVIDGMEGRVEWQPLPDASAQMVPTRKQVAQSSAFNGGEGIWYHQGIVYFSTKGDSRIWAFDVARQSISVVYDQMIRYEVKASGESKLFGVDNITVSSKGEILLCEDGPGMLVVAITPQRTLRPIAQIVGHDDSEITGVAFDPSGKRLYFSSQRGETGRSVNGVTYEVSGPF